MLVQLSSNRKLKGSKSASKGGLKFLSPIPFFLKISRIWSNRWHVFNVLQGMEQIKNEIKMRNAKLYLQLFNALHRLD